MSATMTVINTCFAVVPFPDPHSLSAVSSPWAASGHPGSVSFPQRWLSAQPAASLQDTVSYPRVGRARGSEQGQRSERRHRSLVSAAPARGPRCSSRVSLSAWTWCSQDPALLVPEPGLQSSTDDWLAPYAPGGTQHIVFLHTPSSCVHTCYVHACYMYTCHMYT